jgi:hypothetical protein
MKKEKMKMPKQEDNISIAKAYIRENIKAICVEMSAFDNTGVMVDGHIKKIAADLSYQLPYSSNELKLAKGLIEKIAIDMIAEGKLDFQPSEEQSLEPKG